MARFSFLSWSRSSAFVRVKPVLTLYRETIMFKKLFLTMTMLMAFGLSAMAVAQDTKPAEAVAPAATEQAPAKEAAPAVVAPAAPAEAAAAPAVAAPAAAPPPPNKGDTPG